MKDRTLTMNEALKGYTPSEETGNILPQDLCLCGEKSRGKIGQYCGACGKKIVSINHYREKSGNKL